MRKDMKTKMNIEEIEKYSPGQDCICWAWNDYDCGCGADWTPRITKLVQAFAEMTPSEMKLICGEMTAQEIRTVKAILNWILRRS